MTRMMTDQERMAVSRKSFELEREVAGHRFAARRAAAATAAGDADDAQFWTWVGACLKPRFPP